MGVFTCTHGDGRARKFGDKNALQRPLAASTYHIQHCRNGEAKRKDDLKVEEPNEIQTETPTIRSSWTKLALPKRRADLALLIRNSHAEDVLQRHGYATGNNPKSDSLGLTPRTYFEMPKLPAVALDCEMVGISDGTGNEKNELVRLSAINYLTGEVLIDTLVKPNAWVTNWRASMTGLNRAIMASAEAQGKVLDGWKAAREELWRYVDSNTVIVGHALNNDFKALRMVHSRVVDSEILTSELVRPGGRRWALKTLSEELVKKPIRQGPIRTHNSLEDAHAASEMVHWCLHNEDALREWVMSKDEPVKAESTKEETAK